MATRVSNIRGAVAGGLNGCVLLKATTVHGDAAQDKLTGSEGSDWLLANLDAGVIDQSQARVFEESEEVL
jgi:hypothetical protein